MRILKIAAIAAVMVVSATASVHASVLGGALTFNGAPDQINTINTPVGLSTFVDGTNAGNQAGELDAGDIVFGYIASTQTTNDVTLTDPFNPNSPVVLGSGTPAPFGANEYAASIFSGIVNSGSISGQTFLTAVDPAAGTGFSIPELLGDFSSAGEQLDGVTNAVAAVLSGSTTNGLNDLTSVLAGDLGTFFSSSDFDLEFALSVDGGFFQSIAGVSAFGAPELAQRAGLNIIDGTEGEGFDRSIEFLPVPVASLFAPSVTEADVAVDNTIVALDAPLNDFLFTISSSSIRLNAIPEAASAAVWIGLTTVVAAKARRRKSG